MNKKQFVGGYKVIPDVLAMWPDIHLHKRFNVAWIIFRYQNKKYGYSFVSQKRMRRALAADNRTITNAIEWLKAQGIIRVQSGNRIKANHYYINWHVLNTNPMDVENFGKEGVVNQLPGVVSPLPQVVNQLPGVVSPLPDGSYLTDVRIESEEEEFKIEKVSGSSGSKTAAELAERATAGGTDTTTTTTKNKNLNLSLHQRDQSGKTETVRIEDDSPLMEVVQDVATPRPSLSMSAENNIKEKQSSSCVSIPSIREASIEQEPSDESESVKQGDIPAAPLAFFRALAATVEQDSTILDILTQDYINHAGVNPPLILNQLVSMGISGRPASEWVKMCTQYPFKVENVKDELIKGCHDPEHWKAVSARIIERAKLKKMTELTDSLYTSFFLESWRSVIYSRQSEGMSIKDNVTHPDCLTRYRLMLSVMSPETLATIFERELEESIREMREDSLNSETTENYLSILVYPHATDETACLADWIGQRFGIKGLHQDEDVLAEDLHLEF